MSENETPEVVEVPTPEEVEANPEDGTEDDNDEEQARREAAREQHNQGGSAA